MTVKYEFLVADRHDPFDIHKFDAGDLEVVERSKPFSYRGQHPVLVLKFKTEARAEYVENLLKRIVPGKNVCRLKPLSGDGDARTEVRASYSPFIFSSEKRKRAKDIFNGKVQLDILLALHRAGVFSDELTAAMLRAKKARGDFCDKVNERVTDLLSNNPLKNASQGKHWDIHP